MTTLRARIGRGISAVVGVIALGAASLVGGTAAQAADLGNVDPNAVGSITIHKYEQPESFNPAGDGRELTSEQLSALGATHPLQGVGFTVTPVTLDLSVPANWDNLDQLAFNASTNTVTMGSQNLALGTPSAQQTTDSTGTTTFGNLSVGVYLVQETSPGENNITRAVEPYLVIIPTSIDGTWTYNVHTYPKNSLSEVTKTPRPVDKSVTDENDNPIEIDQEVIWDISATAPVLASTDLFTSWVLTDTLDSRLAYVRVQYVEYVGVELVEDTDYTVTVEGQTVTLTLTRSRLDAIKAAGGNAALTYELVTDATAVGNGIIPNTVTSVTNVNGNEVSVDSTETKTYVGEIDILKLDADNNLALQGAEFQVFASMADAQERTNPIAIDGVTTFVTGADGTVNISPLNVPNATDSRTYYVVEIKAPAGYVTPAGDAAITAVDVVAGTTTPVLSDLTLDAVPGVELMVDNMKQDRPDLPLTGGAGTWTFIAGGLSLMLIAGGIALRGRQNKATK